MARKVLTGDVVPAGELTAAEAATYVAESWRDAVGNIVETGRRLIEAKERVGHGKWLAAVDLMPFGERTARALMQIASHPDLSNRQHVADLPASWGTLAVLAQLPPGEVTKRIEAGDITPEVDRATVQGWVNTYTAAYQEALKDYNEAVDDLTRALSYAKTYKPPVDLPEAYCSIDEFVSRVTNLLDISEGWKEWQ